jgi:hypothetical protein
MDHEQITVGKFHTHDLQGLSFRVVSQMDKPDRPCTWLPTWGRLFEANGVVGENMPDAVL